MASAVGFWPHTGWTWLVRVGAHNEVEVRERVVVMDVLDAELFHHTRDHEGDRESFFAARRADALARAIKALRPLVGGASTAIVLGKSPALPPIAKIVASHAMIHTAEGDLWRALCVEACTACGLAARRALPRPDAKLGAWLAAAREAHGSPWTAEIKAAAIAARRGQGQP